MLDIVKKLFVTLLTPINATAFWTEVAAEHMLPSIDLSIEHLLLDCARIQDEVKRVHNAPLTVLPTHGRVTFTLSANLDDERLKRLQRELGAPPYHLDQIYPTMSESLRACLADALNQGIVVIERPEDHTMPPGQQVLWNTEKQTMRALVSCFNHVLRRLVLLSGWNEDT